MKNMLLALLALITFTACKGQETEYYKVLTPQQYEKQIAQSGVILIDVRTAEEYREGHIGKALNIDVLESNFRQKVQTLDRDKPIYIYCRSGKRSANAGKILEEMGFQTIYDLKGGYTAWEKTYRE